MSNTALRETITLFDRDRSVVDQVSFDSWQEANYNAGEALIDKYLQQLCKEAHVEASQATADSVDREQSKSESSDPNVSRELMALVLLGKTIGFIEYLQEGNAETIC